MFAPCTPFAPVQAQSQIPTVSVEAPAQRARPAAAASSRRSATARTARANRRSPAQQATPTQSASANRDTGERANGPVRGFVATRSGTATKTDTPLIETPQSVSVVTTDQIRNQGAVSIGEALRYTAGVSGDVNGGSDTRFGALQIRGFDTTMSGLYIDGLRIPSSNYVHFNGLDPYGAERLEVLKGPSSAMYGGSGTGGILNYVTKLPTAQQFGEVSISGGSFNRYQGQFDMGGPANKEGTVLWRLTGVVRDGETQVDFTKDNRVFIAPAVTFKPNEDTTITILADYQKDRAGWGLQFLPASGTVWPNNGRTIPVSFFAGVPSFNAFNTEIATAGYLLSHNFTDNITFRQNLRYAYQHNEEKVFYGGGYTNEAAGQLARFGSYSNSYINSFAVDNQLQGKFTTGILSHTTLVGIDYRNTSFRDTAFGATTSAPEINVFNPVYSYDWTIGAMSDNTGVRQSQVGLYAQDQIKLGRLSFQLGGRQDFVTTLVDSNLPTSNTSVSKDASAFTGRAAVMYNFDSGIAPYFSYSESFLPVLATGPSGQMLNPETGVQYEVGVKYQPLGWNALFTFAAFDLTRDNVVTFAPPSYLAEQIGQVKSRGIELEGTMSLADGWNLRAAYAYVDAMLSQDPVNLGKAPPTVPLNRASLWSDFTLQNGPLAGLQFGGGIRYVGATWGDDANTFKVGSSTVLDALLAYTRDNWRLSLNVTNLADTRYVAACYSLSGCFYAEGRKAIGKLTYRW
ncbi:iron complex outermembrane receptor protein [Bradyrhizobium japonicum]|nr:TonB-dependent siderophore receptor [Bradyrhizobium japonicum]MCS3540062.1 iron complex outermembrane receptor protein [Bradyrhizobium japonicum]MCS3992735.1 iron complex outermembrane receptor protein [Bradyrhizobium japonicum]MCS4021333.1 iron complex outermembrane receptor protein [Bradyrhizobium japonicum]MCS4208442.1 iron complex outermembrane receptor protein [Bradyrhizobium japonicum]MDH6173064.1 iron complex outermembrane receptor protein [Bradyrhizobium japonicum]